jgi:hypothetical protein
LAGAEEADELTTKQTGFLRRRRKVGRCSVSAAPKKHSRSAGMFSFELQVADDLKSDIEISRKDAKPQRSGNRLRVIACMHFTDNFTSFTCSVNSFSGNFQDRLGGIAALRDAKSGFRDELDIVHFFL